MAKMWEDLTQAEKIEDLRQDVKRIFNVLHGWESSIGDRFGREQTKIAELAQRISVLEKRA
jgi:hypothetical protein